MSQNIYKITKNDNKRRIDRIIRKLFPELPVSFLYRSLRKGDIRLNSRKVRPFTKVREGDDLYLDIPGAEEVMYRMKKAPASHDVLKIIRPLVLFENKHIVVLNKPRGMLVHGKRSLDEVMQEYLAAKTTLSLSFKPGPVHRLDRNTSGLIIFSASLQGAREMTEIFQKSLCEKYYLALCDGIIERTASWEDYLSRDRERKVSFKSNAQQGQMAVTKVIPVFRGKRHTLALMKLFTGRTHQIRLQAAVHGHPLAGDNKYGGSGILPWYVLHAAALRLKTPSPVAGFKTLLAPLPDSATATLKNVFNAAAIKKAFGVLKKYLH